MSKIILRKYGEATILPFTLFEIDGIDFKVDAVWALGDVKLMKDEGSESNITVAFVDKGQGYSQALTAANMQFARGHLYIVDQGTKVWLDTGIIIETYGHASAQHPYFGEGVWDRRLIGSTHNIPASSGRRLRAIGDVVSGSVDDVSATTTTFITNLAGVHTDHYADQTLLFTSGSLAGMSRSILSYNESTNLVTIEEALPQPPADEDEFDINPVHIHPVSQIVQEIIDDPAYGLAELLTAIKTRLASSIYVTTHPPASVDVTDGTTLEGDNTSIQTLNQIYLKVQESGSWKIDTTYTGIDEEHGHVNLTYRYFGSGSTNHKIELKIWNYTLSQWDDVLATEKDLPATNEDRTLTFAITGTLSDYYTGSIPNLSAQLRIEHVSNFNTDHFFWLDTIGFGDLETIYTAPDNVSIEEIREFTETYVPCSVVGGGGASTPGYAEEGESSSIYQGDVVNIGRYASGDQTAKRLFFGAKAASGDTSYVVGVIECTVGAYDVDADTTSYLIPFVADDTKTVTADTYIGQTEIRDADGVSNPVTTDTFDFNVKGEIVT